MPTQKQIIIAIGELRREGMEPQLSELWGKLHDTPYEDADNDDLLVFADDALTAMDYAMDDAIRRIAGTDEESRRATEDLIFPPK